MIFIALLIVTTLVLAGAAGFFAVFGLAAIFSGTFWSVVFMGSALEAAKLVAASYLYRFWEHTNIWLKTYLMLGILTLMLLTSVGIFGYLSAGYQTDVLPLKQMEEKVQMLEQERTRLLERKDQIDDQIAQLPPASVIGRTRLIREFRVEQTALNTRIAELDVQVLQLRSQFIEKQAHIGPITYIAAVFGLDTDNATKYMIFLIIFAFDPMAVALTLATNIAIRRREEEQAALKALKKLEDERLRKEKIEFERLAAIAAATATAQAAAEPVMVPTENAPPPPSSLEPPQQPKPVPEVSSPSVLPLVTPPIEEIDEVVEEIVEVIENTNDNPPPVELVVSSPTVIEPDLDAVELAETKPEPAETVVQEGPFRLEPESTEEPLAPVESQPEPEKEKYVVRRRTRPYSSISTSLTEAKLSELIQHYLWLKEKRDSGESLTQDDRWEMSAIEELLRNHGMGMYIG